MFLNLKFWRVYYLLCYLPGNFCHWFKSLNIKLNFIYFEILSLGRYKLCSVINNFWIHPNIWSDFFHFLSRYVIFRFPASSWVEKWFFFFLQKEVQFWYRYTKLTCVLLIFPRIPCKIIKFGNAEGGRDLHPNLDQTLFVVDLLFFKWNQCRLQVGRY